MNLNGRVAIVSGASRGIGKGIALALAKAGADIAVNYRRDEASAKNTIQQIQALGRKALPFPADITDQEKVKQMVQETVAVFGKIDILVNNAGLASRGQNIADTDIKEVRRLLDTHVIGAYQLTQAVLPFMRKEKRGDIIFISSIVTVPCAASMAPYVMAKAALEAMMKCLSKEERPYGIRANAIGPGLVDTDMGQRLIKATRGVEKMEQVYSESPFGRVVVPADIGHLCAFLCSEEASYISGQVIFVDGGMGADFVPYLLGKMPPMGPVAK